LHRAINQQFPSVVASTCLKDCTNARAVLQCVAVCWRIGPSALRPSWMRSQPSIPQIVATQSTLPPPSLRTLRHHTSRSLSVSTLLLIAGLFMFAAGAVSDVSIFSNTSPAVEPAFPVSAPAPAHATNRLSRNVVTADVGAQSPLLQRRVCRHTIASPHFVADDRGYFCQTNSVLFRSAHAVSLHQGCCKRSAKGAQRYLCASCDSESACCGVYEHCVSCCMAPEAARFNRAGRLSHGKSERSQELFDVKDTFSICQTVCRSSSSSVTHENAYRHQQHHCYGAEPPKIDKSLHEGLFGFVRSNAG
jgi:SREBP regulating gene protein